jgi:hypothetical protein
VIKGTKATGGDKGVLDIPYVREEHVNGIVHKLETLYSLTAAKPLDLGTEPICVIMSQFVELNKALQLENVNINKVLLTGRPAYLLAERGKGEDLKAFGLVVKVGP